MGYNEPDCWDGGARWHERSLSRSFHGYFRWTIASMYHPVGKSGARNLRAVRGWICDAYVRVSRYSGLSNVALSNALWHCHLYVDWSEQPVT